MTLVPPESNKNLKEHCPSLLLNILATYKVVGTMLGE
jgi:hypothetical protein